MTVVWPRKVLPSGQDESQNDGCAQLRIIEILEDKSAEVMANEQAGYFIHDWQELRDRVRRRHVTRCRLRRCAPSFTIVRVSAHGVLRSKQAISLLRH